MGAVNWIQLTPKRVKGEAVCDAEMNVIVLQNAKNFSIEHITTSR